MITKEMWNTYSFPKKIFLASIAVVSVLVLSTFAITFFSFSNNSVGGVGSVVPMAQFSESDTFGIHDEVSEKIIGTRSSIDYPSVPPPGFDTTVGGDAEAYESLSYTVSYKKPDHVAICEKIASWKSLKHVVFEQATVYDGFCSYAFKVEREHAEGIVNELTELVPEDMVASTESVKKQIMEYDGQLDILLRKEETLRNMLDEAERSYGALTQLATQVEDVESLTKIINSKLAAIERLTNERVMLSQQIDVLARRSAELQDRIEYVRFTVDVTKYKVLDGSVIKNSWERAVRQFVFSLNGALQTLSVGLLLTLVTFFVFVIYGFLFGTLVLVVGKVGLRNARRIWKGREEGEAL